MLCMLSVISDNYCAKLRKSPDLHSDDVVDDDGLEGVAVAESEVRGDEVEPEAQFNRYNILA